MKRKHPLRRIMIGVAATASGVVLLLALKQPGGAPVAGAPAGTGAGISATAGGGGGPSGAGTGESSGADAGAETGAGADTGAGSAGPRTVLGNAVNTPYGPVQVRITVDGGRITESRAVRAPDGDPRSRSVTADAVPRLDRAAVAAGTAEVDAVSGASYTSAGYRASLQSALDTAGL
ncbi:FMN-binding protein [Streptomyces sp. NPDC088258]|uniref:FMN-binding protein n=1 Tax=Streptomyces sp. NPDC088258 TaxID=3365849 RepID=UPI003822CE79